MAKEGFIGANRLKEKFRAYHQRATNNIERALYKGGLQVESDAKLLVIVDTGHLRASIATRLISTQSKTVVEIGTNLEYAAIIEFGSSPHFPPVDALEPWVKRVILNGVEAYEGEAKDVAYAVAKNISKWGTQARPFLQPAYDMNIDHIKVDVKEAIKESKSELKKK
ncbi:MULTISPECIES: HK97 gp10 family phage protein [Vallitalea]|uniref:Uncharacterized protein n=1 Tax=Vallitalea maricola TaxID=3074433 RepID=A0ACB5UH27_9FIRM|nr:HK97 gp10 family phage protein [Vallitalea guaymasensis]GMQ61198.1 hypothetical protein AN2V17_04260 [Vallitalea sp. AN17-2]